MACAPEERQIEGFEQRDDERVGICGEDLRDRIALAPDADARAAQSRIGRRCDLRERCVRSRRARSTMGRATA